MTDLEKLLNRPSFADIKNKNQETINSYYGVTMNNDNNVSELQAADKILAGSFIKVDELIDEIEEEDE